MRRGLAGPMSGWQFHVSSTLVLLQRPSSTLVLLQRPSSTLLLLQRPGGNPILLLRPLMLGLDDDDVDEDGHGLDDGEDHEGSIVVEVDERWGPLRRLLIDHMHEAHIRGEQHWVF